MNKLSFNILLLTVALSTAADAQRQIQPLKLYPDICRYRGDDTQVYTEVYYSFDVSLLKYISVKENFQSEIIMMVYFKRSADDTIVARQAWRIPFSVNDTSLLTTSRSYIDVLGFYLKPDVYRLYIVAKDVNDPTRKDSVSYLVDLKKIDNTGIAISDVELCTSIIPSERDSTNRFYKNTFEVKPNPSRIFGVNQPVLFYYLETYNLLKNKSPNYFTKTSVTNAIGREVIVTEKTRKRVNESSVEVGTVKINQLRTGSYSFNYTVIDSVDTTHYISSKRFFIFNPNLPADTLMAGAAGSVLGSEYAAMTEQELDREFDMARYVSTKDEMNQYNKIKGIEAKRKLLYDFWIRRDPDASTQENEKKKEYFSRLDYTNQNFKTGFRDGWKTDRGRVFIMYGPPDEIERHANEVDVKPYEVWFYHQIQGGVQFIFGDRSGFSDYVLMHSTHRDELHDENWMRQIQAQ